MALHANDLLDKLQLSDDPTHPAQIALRTYGLALFLSLGPSSIPFIVSFLTGRHSHKTSLSAFRRVLRRECGYDGFAFAITLGVGGGATLKRAWDNNAKHNPWISSLDRRLGLSPSQKSFIANFFSSSFSILLLQAGRRRSQSLRNIPRPGAIPIPYTYTPSNSSAVPSKSPSPTLDLTLLVLVRALDSALQSLILKFSDGPEFGKDSPSEVDAKHKRYNAKVTLLTTRLDAFVFWACSARIMWCFFYEPERLPSTYVKWIRTLADVDSRLLRTLRFLRNGEWTYSRGSLKHSTLLTTYAQDLGYPSIWGDPSSLPALGGSQANEAWKILGVTSRKNLGGVPCELVHGSAGSGLSLASSCTANAGIRGFRAFFEAMIIYLPAHFLPILITRPQVLLRPHRILKTLFSTVRSAAFLSSFISSFWLSVCFTRTLALARSFPQVSHDFWDGPWGCILAGCLMCGSSIWIENGRRRGEMSLYVLPRALRACIPERWMNSKNKMATALERLAFVISLSTLLTAATNKPESLRGLSRWGLDFIINGPHAGFWQRRRKNLSTRPGTPAPEGPKPALRPDNCAPLQ